MNICNECKHAVIYCWGEMDVFTVMMCKAATMDKRDIVTGESYEVTCKDLRATNGPCGPSGKLFEKYTPTTIETTRHPWSVYLFGGQKTKIRKQDTRIINSPPPGRR